MSPHHGRRNSDSSSSSSSDSDRGKHKQKSKDKKKDKHGDKHQRDLQGHGHNPNMDQRGYQGGPPGYYPGQGHQRGQPQEYQRGPPQQYQQGPPQGYQQGPPQQYQQGPPQQYQQGPPQHYQQGPPQHYQQGPPQQYQQGFQQQYQHGPPQPFHEMRPPQGNGPRPIRRKSLLIGINYTGSQHALKGCHQDVNNIADFLKWKGYPSDPGSQVILRDDRDPRGPFFPTGHNILAAMHWLISEPNTCCFLHYSGHGSQVKDPDGDRDSGFDDTIVPVDFETNGQIDSDKLHRTLVSPLAPGSTLFVIFDCCHSGSAIELPFVYRTREDGRVQLMDNAKLAMNLLGEASSLMSGGFTMDKLVHARELFSGANSFFKSLKHAGESHEEGLGEGDFEEDWASEHKFVTMFSGCRDDQTSADASISGSNVGAMSWAFIETMKRNPNPTYISTLQSTRGILAQNYRQIPQLSVGIKEMDLNQPLRL